MSGISTVGPLNSGAAVGADGSATKNTDSSIPINGVLLAIQVKYNDSPPAGTTDVVVKTKGGSSPSITLLTITNGATDGIFFPQKATVDNTNTANGMYCPYPIDDIINVSIAQANAADNVDVWLLIG